MALESVCVKVRRRDQHPWSPCGVGCQETPGKSGRRWFTLDRQRPSNALGSPRDVGGSRCAQGGIPTPGPGSGLGSLRPWMGLGARDRSTSGGSYRVVGIWPRQPPKGWDPDLWTRRNVPLSCCPAWPLPPLGHTVGLRGSPGHPSRGVCFRVGADPSIVGVRGGPGAHRRGCQTTAHRAPCRIREAAAEAEGNVHHEGGHRGLEPLRVHGSPPHRSRGPPRSHVHLREQGPLPWRMHS